MNGGMVIEERGCPRHGIRRAVRRGSSTRSFCFNCRSGWTVRARWLPRACRAGAFKAPILRGLAMRAPFFHAQWDDLELAGMAGAEARAIAHLQRLRRELLQQLDARG